jgi:GNAT superfamily N-acetyltransferase
MKNPLALIGDAAKDFLFHSQHQDITSAGGWLFSRIVHLIYHEVEYKVIARSLEDALPACDPSLPFVFQLANLSDLEAMKEVVAPSDLDRFGKRLEKGRICMLALHGGSFIGYGWATDRVDRNIDRIEIPLESGDVYIDDNFTVPQYRGKGVMTALHICLLKYLRERNFKRALAIVERNNIPSQIVLLKKIGYREIDQFIFRRIFARRTFRLMNGDQRIIENLKKQL